MPATLAQAFSNQARYCRANGAPLTALICKGLFDAMRPETELGRKLFDWPGDPLADVVPLRLAAGLRALHLGGLDRLDPLYAGELAHAEAKALVAAIVVEHEAALLPWLRHPPQTNEAGRSAGFMAALKWLAGKGLGPRFVLTEIGSSAGINLMMDRYGYDLGGVRAGPPDSPVQLSPTWKGAAPPDAPVQIVSLAGCDIAPLDLADRDDRIRLAAYVWPEMKARVKRLEAVFAMADENPPLVTQSDAAEFVERQLAEDRPDGVAHIVMHSLVWQYLPAPTQARINDLLEQAGDAATPDRPIAHISLEGDRTLLKHRLRVRCWPGDGQWNELAHAHAHGAWVEWLA